MGPIYSLDDLIDLLRRRAMVIFMVTVLGTLAALFVAISQRHSYVASEVMQIERAKIAGDLVRSTVEGSSGRRLQNVQQQVTSRGVLIEIVDKYGLYGGAGGRSASERAQLLRQSISIDGVAAARDGVLDDGEISVLTITVRLDDPVLVQQVARELSARTIELYAARRIDEARTTLQFFNEQEAGLTARLQRLEDEIADYRAANELSLPGSIEFRRSEISALNSAILDIDREKIAVQRELDQVDLDRTRPAALERELTALRTQLDNLDNQRAQLRERLRGLAASIETAPEVERRLSAYEREREQLREQLASVLNNRTEAEIALTLEEDRKAERLVVLEPAVVPDYPYTPSRKRTALMGTAGALIAGLILAFILDLRRPIIRSAAQMERTTGITPVISVPDVSVSRRKLGPVRRWLTRMHGRMPVVANPGKARKLRGPF
jgi:uncharacterized protein involved in exopolysaccharide biosynthesis